MQEVCGYLYACLFVERLQQRWIEQIHDHGKAFACDYEPRWSCVNLSVHGLIFDEATGAVDLRRMRRRNPVRGGPTPEPE
jgi:hypothetical protein